MAADMSFLLCSLFSYRTKTKSKNTKNKKIHNKKKPYFEIRKNKFFPHTCSAPKKSIL